MSHGHGGSVITVLLEEKARVPKIGSQAHALLLLSSVTSVAYHSVPLQYGYMFLRFKSLRYSVFLSFSLLQISLIPFRTNSAFCKRSVGNLP